MERELSQAQLEQMVVGKPASPNVVFFEKAQLDVVASKREHKRMYMKAVYVKRTVPGVDDFTSYMAQPQDFKAYPEEYQYFLHNKQGAREPGVEIIPGLDIIHLQELRDYGLLTLRKLAGAAVVPSHLIYAQSAAQRILSALEQEKQDGNKQENGKQEETSPEAQAATGKGSVPDRREHAGHDESERCWGVPAGEGDDGREAGKGLHPGRCNDNSQKLSNDWSIAL